MGERTKASCSSFRVGSKTTELPGAERIMSKGKGNGQNYRVSNIGYGKHHQ